MRPAVTVASVLVLLSSGAYAGSINGPVSGYWPDARFVAFGPQAPVPLGYYELCKHGSPVCNPSRGSDRVDLSPERLDQLVAVNSMVNHSIRPVDDKVQYGVADRWSVNPRAGDCEDYALSKKADLLRRGWPGSALLIATATTSYGAPHAVLIARTDKGDLVLDNLVADVRPWRPGAYRWHDIQSPTNEWSWRKIKDGGPAVQLIADLSPIGR